MVPRSLPEVSSLNQTLQPTLAAERFFFCIGSQKTGTTLLAQLIDRHPDMCCTVESYPFAYESDVGMMNPDSERGDKHGYSRELREELFDTWHHSPLNVVRRTVRRLTGLNWTYPGTFRKTMSRAFQDFAERNGARVVGDKWPFYIPHVELLRKAFPEASLIYTVRDPGTPYYAGLILCLVAIGALLHWTFQEAIISTSLVIGMYLAVCLPALLSEPSSVSVAYFINNCLQ